MKKLVLQLMQAKQTNGAFKFSAFLRPDPFPQKQAHQESTCTLLDDNCEPSGSPADTHPNKEENDDPGGSGTEALIDTAIFAGVWLFMICKLMAPAVAIGVLTRHKSSLDLVWLCHT
jgi:hypothetical protein